MGSGVSKGGKPTVVSVLSNEKTIVISGNEDESTASGPTHLDEASQPHSLKSPTIQNERNVILPIAAKDAPPAAARSTTRDGFPGANQLHIESPSLSSVSSPRSKKSVTELELDNLRTELDEVLLGHYKAKTKPASAMLHASDIAVLERHNQLEPLPVDYQPPGPGHGEWVRPDELVRQERELLQLAEKQKYVEKMQEDQRRQKEKAEADMHRKEIENLTVEEQNDVDFDVYKFKVVNFKKDEQHKADLDIYSQATYRNYSLKPINNEQDTDTTNHVVIRAVSLHPATEGNIQYNPSEEALLSSIEHDFDQTT